MIIKYSREFLPMTYSRSELSVLINEFINENESFSFKQICSFIFNRANLEGRLRKEKDTQYQGGIEISYSDETLISQTLWKLIHEKKIFINFSTNPYCTHRNEVEFHRAIAD